MAHVYNFKVPTLQLLVFALLSSFTSASQNTTSKWYFGNNAALDFMTTPPTVIVGSQLATNEGSSGISDQNGNLLFYTDGVTVWTSANTIMANGTGLNGNTSTSQAAIIVKQPGNANIYFIFTLNAANSATGLNYSVVDMSLAAGLGSVTILNVPLAGSSSERLTAVKHCNGIDTWVLSQSWNGDFRSHLVTSTGVSGTFTTSNVVGNAGTGPAYVGCMKFSPNGRKLGLAAANDPNLGFEIYDFDATTGIVSNRLFLIQNSFSFGVEFSPDGTKMYGALWGGPILFEWDLCAGNGAAIVASVYTTTTNDGGSLQLSKDGKIYMSRSGFNVMGEIPNPNVMGAGNGYTDNGQSIAPNTNSYGLPNFITSAFKQTLPPFTSTVNCVTASFNAPQIYQNYTLSCPASGYSLTNMVWNFGDPASGAANTSTLTNPLHHYSGLGTYTANLILYFSCGGGTDTIKQTVTINQACINVMSNGITCASLGSASVTAMFGTGPYSYYWLPAGPSGSLINNVYPGTYSVSVYDIGTSSSFTLPVTFTSSMAYTNTLSVSPSVPCFGSTTGTASILVSGGSGTQNCYWYDGNTTVITPTRNSLPAGNYTVTVVDAVSSCSTVNTFSITQPPNTTLNIAASGQTLCVNTPVTFTATNSGGVLPYTYTWTNGPQTDLWTTTQATGGVYVYTVTSRDANQCQKVATIPVNYGTVPIPSITANSNSLCFGSSLFLTGIGGNTFSWTGPNGVTGNLPNLVINSVTLPSGGIYTLNVISGPCTASTSHSVVIFPLPTPSFASSLVCENHNMTLTATPGGGTAFAWTGPQNFNSNQQNPVLPLVTMGNSGIYSLTATDVNLCKSTVTGSVVILQNPFVVAVGSSVCLGTPAKLVASGAVSYQWTGPNGFTASTGTVNIAAAPSVSQASYTVTGTALNGCTNVAVAYVNTTPLPIPSVSITPRACVNETITMQGFGGVHYDWKGPYNFSGSGSSVSFAALNLAYTGVYTVTAFDQLGCFATATDSLKLDPLPQGSLKSNAVNNCIPFCADFSFNLNSPAPLSSLSWQINGRQLTTPVFNHCFTTAGKTLITAKITDNIGCSNINNFEVEAYALPVANFDFYPQSPIEGIDQVEFVDGSSGASLAEWRWYFVNNNSQIANTKTTNYTFAGAGVYPVAMVVKNTWGCTDTSVKTIKVENDFGIYIPNAFTPNIDGKNDLFMAKGIGIVKYNMIVYNRWGQKIFESDEILKGWDGTYKGNDCPTGVYIWKLSAKNQNGKEFLQNGHVTLYR